MEDQWLHWAKRLQAIGSTGLYFTGHEYDRERYEEVAQIANAMLAQLGNVPINRIESLVPQFARGYATPQIDVRGAVFDGERVLLVQERSDELWTLPGGFADVGLSAAENVVKEIAEEASVHTTARRLYCIRHKAKHPYRPDTRDFYKLHFICDAVDAQAVSPAPGPETLAAGFFDVGNLPALSEGRVITADIEEALRHHLDPTRAVVFD